MAAPFTILQGKDTGKQPLFLITIVAPDGDTTYLTSATYYGGGGLSYNGHTYLPRIVQNDIEAIQATGPQGYSGVPSTKITIGDADKLIWLNHCMAHGWSGSIVTLTVVLWDLINNQYSTDALEWEFFGGNPSHNYASGQTVLTTASYINFSRIKLPSVPVSTLCPWAFPVHLIDRINALSNFTSAFFQCPYSPDVSGGVGNLIASTTTTTDLTADETSNIVTVTTDAGFPATPFQATIDSEEVLVTSDNANVLTILRAQWNTDLAVHSSGSLFLVPYPTCELVRSSPDPSVGCMARLGDASDTSISIDGNLLHDKAGHRTGEFGGNTWLVPTQFSGKSFLTGNKVTGFNQANQSLVGSFYNNVYGTQWVNLTVLAPAGEPNSYRSECVVCVALQKGINVLRVVAEGVEIPQNGSDNLFTWRYIPGEGGAGDPFIGGRKGAINRDNIYNSAGTRGPDPHGSLPFIEVVVPTQLSSISNAQALITGPPILHCFPIATAVGSGGNILITLTAGVTNGFPGISTLTEIFIAGCSLASANGVQVVSASTAGPPGTITLVLTGTGSGTGGGIYFYAQPELYDNGSSQDGNLAGPAANAVWAYLDAMTWGNLDLKKLDALTWYNAAQIAAIQISYQGTDGNTYTHAQFKASFAFEGTKPEILAGILTALGNACNILVGANSSNGLIQCFIKQTLADQQPDPIPGSNDQISGSPVARSSLTALGIPAVGYLAMVFDETNIEDGSFEVITTSIEETPNTFSTKFQDEYNGYQLDSLQDTDPQAYAFAGNQKVNVPIPILGAPNFDQNIRCGNVRLAEALFGNPRNDPGGTLYFRFTINVTVIGLASRIGFICGLVWQGLGIGAPGNPQYVRVMSLKPDTNGTHWQVRVAWHQDLWYTYAFGQNPSPFQNTPINVVPIRPPYPWRPFQLVNGLFNPLLLDQSFTLYLDITTYPALISASGYEPINAAPSVRPPLIPLQASTANTGGVITPGRYTIAVSTNGQFGPVSKFATVLVPAGTNTNSISISGIIWQSGAAVAPAVYIGIDSMHMGYIGISGGGSWTGSVPDTNGNPTTITIGAAIGTYGLPDELFYEFAIFQQGIAHGGVWADVVTAVSGVVATIGDAAFTVNEWAGRVLTLYYSPDASPQFSFSRNVVSNTSNTITSDHSGAFSIGDVVTMRCKATTFSASTIGDSKFVNSYYPAGLAVDGREIGRIIMIIAGTGKNTTPKTVISNTSTVYTIAGTFDVTPDATSIFIVLYPTIARSYTGSITNNGTTTPPLTGVVVASVPAATTAAQSMLVTIATADANGKYSPLRFQPYREIFIPAQLANPNKYFTITVVGGIAVIDFFNGFIQRIILDGTAITINAPIWTGGAIANGTKFTLLLDQDATGGRAIPTFVTGAGAFAADIQGWQIDGTASTRTTYEFVYSGTWDVTSTPVTGGSIT